MFVLNEIHVPSTNNYFIFYKQSSWNAIAAVKATSAFLKQATCYSKKVEKK